MQKIFLGAIIAATVLLVYPSMMPEQSVAQTADQSASTDAAASGGLPCNTSARSGPSLTIDGINATNGKPCVFEIQSFSFGVGNPTTIGSGTGGADSGKASFHDISITKRIDSVSPILFKNTATGEHYKQVIIHMRKAGGDQQSEFLTYTFGTVFTTKIDWSGPGDQGPQEQITFVYGTLKIDFKPQKPDGTLGVPISSCFDVMRNVVC
jgi:type VI secretion system secreted protein Hcp